MDNDARVTADGAARLERTLSESNTASLQHVTLLARETFGDDDKARRWLHRPTTALSGSRPLDVLAEGPSGARKVIDLLKRIDHGLSV